ncbi:VOC family protein [soil metagenome]
MDQRISTITLGVGDLARSRRFYEQGLGWTRGGGADDIAFYQAGGMIVGLYERAKLAGDAGLPNDGSGFTRVTLGICVRNSAEVDTLLRQAEAAGARILVSGRKTFWGGYDAYFADPDGHAWELMWHPGLRMDETGAVFMAST